MNLKIHDRDPLISILQMAAYGLQDSLQNIISIFLVATLPPYLYH